jgi:YegS/Rv2252/BmrU family lipid kinase
MKHPKNTWYVIVNPVAGFGKVVKKWKALFPLLEKEFALTVVFTERDRHAVSLTKEAIEAGYSHILAVGGDGTLHQVVNGMMLQHVKASHEISIAFYSCGTGNDWIRSFDFPKNNVAFVEMLKQNKTLYHDVGKVYYFKENKACIEYFNNIAGVGFDAYVIQQTKNKTTGQFSYLVGMLRSLFSYRCNHLKVTIHGETHDAISYLTLAAINKYAGGGMKLAPDAVNNDGRFDVILVKEISKWEVVKHTSKLFSGKYLNLPQVSVFRSASFTIEALENPSQVYCEADGELTGTGPFEFVVVPAALNIVIP